MLGPFWLQLSFKTGAFTKVQDTSFLSHLLFHRQTQHFEFTIIQMSLFWMYTYWLYLFWEVFSQLCIICFWGLCSPKLLVPHAALPADVWWVASHEKSPQERKSWRHGRSANSAHDDSIGSKRIEFLVHSLVSFNMKSLDTIRYTNSTGNVF